MVQFSLPCQVELSHIHEGFLLCIGSLTRQRGRTFAGQGTSRKAAGRLPERGRAGKRAGCSLGRGEAGPQNDGLLPDFRREVLLVASLTGRTAPGFTTRVQLLAKMATVCHFLEKLNGSGSEIGEVEWP